MSFSFDINGNLKQSKMFLYNSKTNPIGTIVGATNIKLEQNFHKLFELNFRIYKNINNVETEFYDRIIKNKLIELQYINWFQILSAIEKYDDESKETYKEVKCCPLENALIYRKVYDINGVFGLYDIYDTSTSLLHIISAECGWTVGHVSNSLLSKFRTFSIDSMEIYNLLTTKIQDAFGCIFQFDSYSKTINAYLLSELNELTDIVISKKNVLKDYIKDDSEDQIITKMRVIGGDDGNGGNVDIRSINFGRNYLINLDYFMTTEWVDQSLVNAYNTYKTAISDASSSYNTAISNLKIKQSELTILKSELKNLESQQNARYIAWQSLAELYGGTPPIGSADYTLYTNALNAYNSYFALINSKESEIQNKKNEINVIESTLNNISDSIDESNYFTQEQISKMNEYIYEGENFENSTYVITSETTEEEAIEIKTELKQAAEEDLTIKSKPNYTFTIKASSLYTIQDDKDELISYSEWREQLKVGSLITIFIDNTWTTVRLMSIIIDFDNPEEIEMKFSSKNRLDDELTQLAEILADSGRTSRSMTLKQFGYDKASKLTNPVREFMNGTLNATLNKMVNNDNQEIYMDSYGLHGRKWLPDQNKYDDSQVWLNNNTLLFTDDGWKSAKSGIGKFTNSSGETFYGVLADIIVGNFVLTSALTVSNQNNTITMNKDGATFTNCNITINKGINSLYLNATDGIKLTKSGVSQFYIDANGNAVFNGTLGANSINADMINALNIVAGSVRSDWIYTGSLSASQITAGSISGDRISGGTITGTTINGVTIIGSLSVSTPNAYFTSIEVRGSSSSTTYIYPTSIETTFLTVSENISCATLNNKTPSYSGHTHSTSGTISATLTTSSEVSADLIDFSNTYGNSQGATAGYVKAKLSAQSDERLKENVYVLGDITDKYMQLNPVSYTFKKGAGNNQKINYGFIAQDIDKLYPKEEYSFVDIDHEPLDGQKQYCPEYILTINQNNLHAMHVKMIQQLYNEVNRLKIILINNGIPA